MIDSVHVDVRKIRSQGLLNGDSQISPKPHLDIPIRQDQRDGAPVFSFVFVGG
jgi:hypothetical protein